MRKEILLVGLLAFAIAVSGCIEPVEPVCGNGVCDQGETPSTCSQDCTDYHTECKNQKCTVVEGTGTDACSVDADCRAAVEGTSFETAIVIEADSSEDGISMEYEWLYANGCEGRGGAVDVEMQELQENDDHWFDLLHAVCGNGETVVYYFQIDSFFGNW